MNHWTVRVRITEQDPDTGKMRSKMETYLVEGETIEQAQKLVKEFFRGMTIDYEVRGIGKSGIVEYIDSSILEKLPKNEYDAILNK